MSAIRTGTTSDSASSGPSPTPSAKASLDLSQLLDLVPGAREEALELARFACTQSGGERHRELAELADFPIPPFATHDDLEGAHQALECLAGMLLTQEGEFRKRFDKTQGFPAERKFEKARVAKLIADLDAVPGLESALAGVRALPPARYPEDDWLIVRACFTVLRYAAGQLKVVFAETAKVDFIEVAQVALATLQSEDGFPSEAAFAVAEGIRHLLGRRVPGHQPPSIRVARRPHRRLARSHRPHSFCCRRPHAVHLLLP